MERPTVRAVKQALARGTAIAGAQRFAPGTALSITCPVVSQCSMAQVIDVRVKIHNASSPFQIVEEKWFHGVAINPGGRFEQSFNHVAVADSYGEGRNILVDVLIAGKEVVGHVFDDAFFVGGGAVSFAFEQPTITVKQ